jgi:hypothetical protein
VKGVLCVRVCLFFFCWWRQLGSKISIQHVKRERPVDWGRQQLTLQLRFRVLGLRLWVMVMGMIVYVVELLLIQCQE